MKIKDILLTKNSIFYSWLKSYLIILLVPILFSGIVYLETLKIIKHEINYANRVLLEQVQMAVDSKMQSVENLSMQISLNERLLGLMYRKSPLDGYQRNVIQQLCNEMRVFSIITKSIKSVYIYFKNNDFILSPAAFNDPKTFFMLNEMNYGIKFEEWYELLQVQHKEKYVIFSDSNYDKSLENSNIVYVQSLPFGSTNSDSLVNIFLILDKEEILKTLQSTNWVEEGCVMVIDRHNRKLVSTDESQYYLDSIMYDQLSSDKVTYHELNGESVVVTCVDSKIMDWKYVSIIPTRIFMKKISNINKISFYIILIALSIGCVISYFFSRRNYNPVNDLISIVKKSTACNENTKSNEYDFIKEVIQKTINQQGELHQKLDEQEIIMRRNFLLRLLTGKIGNKIPINELLASYDIEFYSDQFAVMLFNIEDYSGFCSDCQTNVFETVALAQFGLSNILSELIECNHKCYIVEMDGLLACIVNIKQYSKKGPRQELMDVALYTKEILEKYQYIYLTVSISSVETTIMGIQNAYEQAMEAMEYKMIKGSGEVIHYEDIMNADQLYSYSSEIEHRLANCIKAGDFDGTKDIIENIYKDNFADKYLSIDMARCFMFGIINTIIKTMNEISMLYKSIPLEQTRPLESILHCETIDKMKLEIINDLEEICEYIRNLKKQNKNDELKEQIIEYIYDNYHDVNLCISSIADYFKINPVQVSRFFKEQFGVGLIDYINKTRIDKAKELLRDDVQGINDTAEAVGYSSSSVFIRVFKKYEGITPGIFKKKV